MEILIVAAGFKDNLKGMEFISGPMEIAMKVCGTSPSSMVKVQISSKMVISFKVHIKMENLKVKVNTGGRMVLYIQDSSMMG